MTKENQTQVSGEMTDGLDSLERYDYESNWPGEGGDIRLNVNGGYVRLDDVRALLSRAQDAQAVRNAALPKISIDEMEALKRFQATCEDGEGYDVPKQMMQRLASIGLINHLSRGIYEFTDFGLAVLESAPAQPVERPDAVELPPLPAPSPTHYRERGMQIERMEMYTADQMRKYALAAIAANQPQPHGNAQEPTEVVIHADDIHWFEEAFRAWECNDMEGVLDGLATAVNHFMPESSDPQSDAHLSEKDKDFYRGVIAALGALAPHSTHGDTMHDEIVKAAGKEQLYSVAEPEDVEWAGLDPEFYAALTASTPNQKGAEK